MNIQSLLQRPFAVLLLLAGLITTPQAMAQAPVIPSPPQLAAKSWVLMEASSGQILVEHNGDERLPPASLTKLMTAYIATLEINQGRLQGDDNVLVSEKAWKTGGSRMFVKVNEPVSVDNLLHGIIIQSGNDASVALAEHIGGSEEGFADLMNANAQRLGLRNTHFVNATGLPHEQHYSSAHDMARLARAIIFEDPQHYAIYSQKEFTWNDIRQPNRNLLLRDKTVDGLKTGHTEEAGYCLVASAVRDDMRLIGVVFGADSEKSRAAELQKLLTWGFRFYETRTFYQKHSVLTQAQVWKGNVAQVALGPDQDLTLVLPRGQADRLQASMVIDPQIEAPVLPGQQLGRVEVRLDGQVLQTVPLVAINGVEEGGFFRRLWDSIRLFIYGLLN